MKTSSPVSKGVLIQRSSIRNLLVWACIAVILAASWQGADMRPWALVKDANNMLVYMADFYPPNFTDWRLYLDEMRITVQIAVWGTFLAIVAAVPLSLLCSANMTPAWIHFPMRRCMDACRAINEIVFAMLFIVAVGLGPFAGVLALAIHTTGTLAKLFSEAVEAIDARPIEGVRATGANAVEEIVYGVIPQVLPLWISFALYRFESNVRSATVLGIVGAGGIGTLLWDVIRSFQYAQTAAILVIIVLVVSLIDIVSAQIRKALV